MALAGTFKRQLSMTTTMTITPAADALAAQGPTSEYAMALLPYTVTGLHTASDEVLAILAEVLALTVSADAADHFARTANRYAFHYHSMGRLIYDFMRAIQWVRYFSDDAPLPSIYKN